MLDKVKAALRIKTAAFDGELKDLVAACLADLVLVGISATDETTAAGDPLIVRAVILYAKANFGFDPDAERYQRAYDLLKMSLALSSEHGGDEIV